LAQVMIQWRASVITNRSSGFRNNGNLKSEITLTYKEDCTKLSFRTPVTYFITRRRSRRTRDEHLL